MRVLVTVPYLVGGGAEFVASQWARYLADAGDNVTVYATHSVANDQAPPGVSLVRARSGNIIAQTHELARYLRASPVDFVIGINSYSNLMIIAAGRSMGRKRPGVIISQHSLARLLMRSTRNQRVQQWLARRLYRFSDLLVAVSHPVAAEAMAEYGLSRNQIAVVPNPALSKFQDARAGRHSRGEADPIPLGDHRGRLNIVVAGRLMPEKRPVLAVDIAAKLSEAVPVGVTVHYFGVGDLHDAVIARAEDLGVDVLMHGWVPDWFEACPRGSIVLVPSLVEGFGNVLIEAAAAGFKSVVSSRCMGVADAVIPGITGELITGDSVEEYVEAVLACLRGPAGSAAPWLQRFSLESSGRTLRNAIVNSSSRALIG